MKNILLIQGGGRPKGNTAQLVEYFIKGAEEAGQSLHHPCISGLSHQKSRPLSKDFIVSLKKTRIRPLAGMRAIR